MTDRTMPDVREAIVLVCRRLYDRGLVAGPDGNVSVRRDDGTVLVTPTGLAKVDVTPDDLVVVSLEGRVREGRLALTVGISGPQPPVPDHYSVRKATVGSILVALSAGR